MNGIYYFSGTGNSLYIAKKIKEELGGEVRFIKEANDSVTKYDRIILVSPIYAFSLPYNVLMFLKEIPKNTPLDIVLNYGGAPFGTANAVFGYTSGLRLNVKGIYTMRMPLNFTLLFPIPKSMIKKAIKKAPQNIDMVILSLKDGKTHLPRRAKYREKMGESNPFSEFSDTFIVSDKCTGCGKCAKVCPYENIVLTDGKVTFGKNCLGCLSCYHRCTAKAIVTKQRKDEFRFINPEINEEDIGKDFDI